MEILKKKIELTVYGEAFELKKPTALEAAEFKKSITDINDDVLLVQKAIDFIVSIGLKKEIADQLDLSELQSVIEYITTKKK